MGTRVSLQEFLSMFVDGKGYVDGKQIKKIYFGQNGTAIKLKKLYIGEDGAARLLCKCGGELKRYGTITALGTGRTGLLATTIGDYALFGGGQYGSGSITGAVDSYDKSFTRSSPSIMQPAIEYGVASNGVYAIFGGGHTGSKYASTNASAYDTSLTLTETTLSQSRLALAGASVGDYVLFAGGKTRTDSRGTVLATVETFNKSLTKGTATDLSSQTAYLLGASLGSYAIFTGGYYTGNVTTVNAYNKSLTKTNPTSLSGAVYLSGVATNDEYVIFGGGQNVFSLTSFALTDAYNKSLTRCTVPQLSLARHRLAGASLGKYAMLGGGEYTDANLISTRSAIIDVYDTSLTRTNPVELSLARYGLAGVTLGDYALFGGGDANTGCSAVVDAYTLV